MYKQLQPTVYFRLGAAEAGTEPEDGASQAVARTFVDLVDPTAVTFRDGAREALEAARRRHDVALVTNGSAGTQASKLEFLGIEDAFAIEVYCDPTAGTEPKPDPAPLEAALEELGVPAERTLLVGDALSTDVAAAGAVGARSAWVPRDEPDPEPTPEPSYLLDSMTAVVELL